MARIDQRLLAAPLLFFSFSALAQSDAYKAGYSVGQQIGRFIALALPVAGIALAILVAVLVFRAWRKRRNVDDGQISARIRANASR